MIQQSQNVRLISYIFRDYLEIFIKSNSNRAYLTLQILQTQMYAKKNADKRIDIKTLTLLNYLNNDRTVYLAENKSSGDQRKRYIVKVVPIPSDPPQFQSGQQAIIKKMFTSSIYYFKPQFYDFKDNYLHLCMKVQPLSLQTLIWIHKRQNKNFSSIFIRDFTVRLFEGIARLKSTQIFPQNLKPSNIFLQIKSLEDKNWVWSEAGLHTVKRNQFYYKINMQNIGKNNSVKVDPYQMQFYSLAIILVQMITLQPAHVIDKTLRTTGRLDGVQNFDKAGEYYGERLIQIINLLIQPPKDNSLNKAIQEYKQSQDEEDNQMPNYDEYGFTQDRLQSFIKDQLLRKIDTMARDYIKDKNLTSRDVFEKMAQLDPEFHFAFSGIKEFQELLDYIGIQVKSSELIYLATFFTSMSQIRYFKFIQSIFPPIQLIQNIISKASENYDSFKQFFESQTSGKDFWKVEQIKLFLQSLEVPFFQKDIVDAVKEWTKGSSKTSIKYPQIYAAFKPIMGLGKSILEYKKPNATVQGFNDGLTLLKIIMQRLKKKIEQDKGEDLITFFRKNDIKQNWTVDSKIYKIIKNYTKDKDFDDEKYRKAFLQMQKQGSIEGDMTKQINYIYLIRNLELQEPLTLLRQVITQKINQSNRDAFFSKYEKNQRGWTFQSLQQFNKDEVLEFSDRQLKALFSEMDSDHSGTVQTKELFYKLTNVKEFDYDFIIQAIKQKTQKEGIYLFNYFEQVDPRARLVLSNSGQLHNILQNLGVELSSDHLNQLYNKFSKKGRFDYLAFCRQFHPLQKLFMSSIRFILTQHYKGSFDKLYQMGLKENKKKWSLQSLSLINQEMVLGFRQNELQQIWKIYDPNDQGSLTKQEVAHLFNYQFIKTSQLTTKALESIKDLPKRKDKEARQEVASKKQLKPMTHRSQKTQQSLIQSFKRLEQLNGICLKLINSSPDKNGIILMQQCISVFQDSGIQQNRKQLEKLFLRFKIQWTKKLSINFIQFFFFLYDQIYIEKQQMIPKIKASLALQIIKEIKKLKKITNSQIYEWCRQKDKMRYRDFQEVMNKLTDVEIFSSDLQHIWSYWGQREYFTQQDFDTLLQTKEYKPKMEKQKSEKEKQPNLKLQKRQSNKPRLRLAQQNKMIDFITEAEGSDTPYLNKPLSFGEKDPTFRKQSSHRNSIHQSANRQDAHETPINKFKADSTQRQRQIRGLEKKKSSFQTKRTKQQKLELQQFNNPIQDNSKRQQKFKTTYSKNQLLQKFRQQVTDVGENYISELFSKTNIIQVKRFISCLTIHYNFSEEQASQLGQHISKFDKIKLDTLKQYLYKSNNSPDKNVKQKGKSRQKFQKNRPNLQNSPSNFKKQAEGKKIIDPRRQKINIPLVRETIKSMKIQFCKRFDINELEAYFFSSKDNIARQEFINKCQSISTKFSSNICQKMFDYLKPDNQDKISILSFKLGMGLDEPVDEQQDDYLPEQLQKELKIVFEKADRDHSGFIQSNQIEQLLASLGFNENLKEIQNYFAKMDQNFDNRISYSQFRRFIEDQILPQMSDFDQDQQQLQESLRNNDIFRSGCLAATTFQAVIERYGVKISQLEVQILVRSLNPEGTQINIRDFLNAVRDPSIHQGKVKGVLYKIRLRKKVQLREIQKIFENISSCFVLAYTPAAMQKEILNISSPYRPVLHESGLFYNDLPIRDAKKIGQSEEGLVGGQIANNDILVEIALKQVNGVPIPQKNEIKSNIMRRYMNISFFDLSAQALKSSIWQIQAQFDPQAQDVWRFSNAYRSIFIKVAGYQPRKYEKIVLLFELVIDVVEGNRTLEINCGCSNMPLRQLIIPQGKTAKKLKLIAGLPNRSKEIDKNSVSKRSGWKNFFGGDIQSELQVQLVHQNKFKQYHRMLAALPSQVILGRKALHYLWTYRQTMAENVFEGTNVNPLLNSDMRMIAFRLSLDVPEAFGKVWLWWKEKVQSRVKSFSEAKRVFKILMQQLYLIFNANQFQLIKRCPCKVTIHNKSLSAARNKMINEALENVQNWITTGLSTHYKRKKNYNFNYGPFQMHEIDMPKQHRNFMENIAKMIAK